MDDETKKAVEEVERRYEIFTAFHCVRGRPPAVEPAGKFSNDIVYASFLASKLREAHAEIVSLKIEINQMREDEGFPPLYAL